MGGLRSGPLGCRPLVRASCERPLESLLRMALVGGLWWKTSGGRPWWGASGERLWWEALVGGPCGRPLVGGPGGMPLLRGPWWGEGLRYGA